MLYPNRQVGRLLGLLLALLPILCLGISPTRLGGAEVSRLSFALVAADAEVALEKFSEQSGAQIAYLLEDVRGVTTNPVEGRFAIREALDRLLAGTVLEVEQDGKTGAYAIRRDRKARPLAADPASPNPPRNPLMKSRKSLLARLAAGIVAFGSAVLSAQTIAGAPPPAAPEETITLSPFEVKGEKEGRYKSTEATSGGRVRVSLFNYSNTISIIPRELFDDTGANRIIDAAKYVSSVTEGFLPFAGDFIQIRGFQTEGQTVDGFFSRTQTNIDPIFTERLEVVKGPSSVLAPRGSPGGTINIITRKPEFRNFGSITAEFGIYDANRAQLDVNRVFGAKNNFAFRLVAAEQNTEGYANNDNHATNIMPMVSMLTKSGAKITLQGSYTRVRAQSYLGLVIDPSSGSTNNARILDGVPNKLNIQDNDDLRKERRYEWRAFVTAPLSDSISMRLAGRYADIARDNTQHFPVTNQSGGATNPLTGLYEPGFVFGPGPAFIRSPAPQQSNTFPRIGSIFTTNEQIFDVQGDFVHEFKSEMFSSTTTAGFNYTGTKTADLDIPTMKPPVTFGAPRVSTLGAATIAGPTGFSQISNTTREQAYISESVDLWSGRIVLSSSYSFNNFDITLKNRVAGTVPSTIANTHTTLFNYGAVIKPIPSIALYYNRSENGDPADPLTIATGGEPLKEGQQHEFGGRFKGWHDRLFITVTHFRITQTGFAVPNPGNLTLPPPSPLLPFLVSSRKAKGWEYEARFNLTDEFSLIGNYSDFTNRDPFGKRARATAEHSWAVVGRYEFPKESRLRGFDISLAANHLGRRAGESPGGITVASTPTNLIANDASFFLGSRTLVDFSAGYNLGERWRAQVNIDNVFDKEYVAAAIIRTIAFPGASRNARLVLTYKF